MYRTLIEGMLSKQVLRATTKLLMPWFLSQCFFIRTFLVIYIGGWFYSSVNLADFDIPTHIRNGSRMVFWLALMILSFTAKFENHGTPIFCRSIRYKIFEEKTLSLYSDWCSECSSISLILRMILPNVTEFSRQEINFTECPVTSDLAVIHEN